VASESYLKWIDHLGAGATILNGNFRLVEVGDFDNDNDDDLVFVYQNNDIYSVTNQGGGTFGSPVFIKNQFVILGESRFHAFVKKLDEQAFIYDTIATIKSAITKA
jgi:hypothetical protein